ncbi:MAG: tripartite tricarboxylate transporter substrate binding protein [Pseudomonadota bacterium]
MTMPRFLVALFAFAALPFSAHAQDWPNRPIRFIVPYPAGGSTDVGARVIGEHLSRALGQQVVVENKSGGSGTVGFEYAGKSAPDGYTVLIAPDQITSAPHVFKVSFDALKDFAPVIQLSRQPVVLAAHPKLGVNKLSELIALVKEKPGLSYATSGVGSQQHMAAEWFAKLAGIKLEHVPYRGGGQAINDLLAGHITLASLGSTPLIPHYRAGALKLLAQSTAARSPTLPDVPTYEESGVRLVLDQWLGVFVPTGTPPAVAARLNAEMNKALQDAGVRKVFADSAQEPVGGTAEQFGKLVQEDFGKYDKLVRELNIKVN